MNEFIEKRDGLRLNVDCEIYCKPQNSTELYKAKCISLSNTGISFLTKYSFTVGEKAEVNIFPEDKMMETMKFSVNIVRYSLQQDGLFEVGAVMNL